MNQVLVSAPLLEWAQERAGRNAQEVRDRFPKWDDWLAQSSGPTFNQLEHIASFLHTPIGYLFLNEPPQEELPIPDFRVGRGGITTVSDTLLDTIYQNQRRQFLCHTDLSCR